MRETKIFNPDDFPAYLPKLNLLYDELFSLGKGFRAKLVRKVAGALALPERDQTLLAQTVEFIHNASLLHDDLVDRSTLRRGKPAAWLKHSPEYAVLAGDYLLARVMVNLSRHGNLALIQYTAEMISDLLEGEWIQDSLVQDWNVHLDQLDRVHDLKTSSLFKWCLRAPWINLRCEDVSIHELSDELGALLGLLFQRGDDLLDFNIRNDEDKGILGDLKAGYLNSFAAFLARNWGESKRQQLRQCKSLDEVWMLTGRAEFEAEVKAFDEMNKEVIALFLHKLEQLSHRLSKTQTGLIEALKPLPHLLYFRGS
jgi:octaprenyl-diphosphate synthase